MKRYVPTKETAKGGIGKIVVYRDNDLDRKVVVKFLQAGGDHRRLLDELNALQRVRSKHVVEIYDVDHFEPGGRMGIMEEYIDGRSLEDKLGTVKADQAFLRLMYQAACGVADIHAVGVVHRDIKPSNMLVDGEGILKIIDFNLSRDDGDAQTVGFVGTHGYGAPELYSDGDVAFDKSIDVYALGVTAWALLVGDRLHPDLRSEPPRPDRWKADTGGFASQSLDGDLAELLDAAIVKPPRTRPSAAALRSRLSRHLLRNRHRALFIGAASPFELSAKQPRVRLSDPRGEVVISYDGLDFRAIDVQREVWVNNIQLEPGARLPDCCVIALGGPTRKAVDRQFITMDVSHPEVVL